MTYRTFALIVLLVPSKMLWLEGLTSSPGEQAYVVSSDFNQGGLGKPNFSQVPAKLQISPGRIWHLDSRLVPTREEMLRILNIAKERNARDYVFFAICSHTGFRLSEVAHLKASDVGEHKIVVTRRKKKILQPTVVDVPDNLWPTLSEWAASFDGYLFPGTAKPCIIHRTKKDKAPWDEQVCSGGHVHVRTLQRAWAMIVAEAGLRKHGRGIHQTRHYFATQFYTATRDLRATQEALAHSNLEMTARYAHIVDMKEKVNSVPGLL